MNRFKGSIESGSLIMCTVTLHRGDDRLLLTMNRDEAKTRSAEKPPKRFQSADSKVAWIMPLDGASGGTWIGANSYGVTACLVNAYPPDEDPFSPKPASTPSRGVIIPQLLAQGGINSVSAWLRDRFDPTPFRPFTLTIASKGQARSISWTRDQLRNEEITDEWTLLVSSLWKSEEVTRWRRRKFEEGLKEAKIDERTVIDFHLLQVKGEESFSPLMDRPFSCTRSITQIEIDFKNRTAEMRYWSKLSPHTDPGQPASRLQLTSIPDSPGDYANG